MPYVPRHMSTLALELEQELRSRDPEAARRLEQAVRAVLRAGRKEPPAKQTVPVLTQPRPLGLKPGLSYDKIGALLAAAEGENWK
jgi:hypothetical protein